jgi:hypothetical protein
MKNPMKQADRSKYRFKDLRDNVLGIDQENQDYCLVESAVWFPSVSRRDEIGDMPMDSSQSSYFLKMHWTKRRNTLIKFMNFIMEERTQSYPLNRLMI